MKLKKCPICKKELLPSIALKNHIYGKAQAESYAKMKDLFNFHKRNFKSVSRIVLLRQMPHFNFVKKKTRIKTLEYLRI